MLGTPDAVEAPPLRRSGCEQVVAPKPHGIPRRQSPVLSSGKLSISLHSVSLTFFCFDGMESLSFGFGVIQDLIGSI